MLLEFSSSQVEQTKVDAKKIQIAHLLDKVSPDETEANNAILKQYDGREDELILQLEELVEATPFDEPSVSSLDSISMKEKASAYNSHPISPISSPDKNITEAPLVSPNKSILSAHSVRRVQTASTGMLSRNTRNSGFSNTTTKHSNTRKSKSQRRMTDAHDNNDDTCSSLSGNNMTRDEKRDLPRVDEIFEESFTNIERKRDLNAEVYIGKNYSSKTEMCNRSSSRKRNLRRGRFNRRSAQVSQKTASTLQTSSFEESIGSTDDYKSDSSTVSELSAPLIGFDQEFHRGRAKVRLKKAIKNKDWERASSISASLRSGKGNGAVVTDDEGMNLPHSIYTESKGGTPDSKSKLNNNPLGWTQGKLDKFIAENDWDSVFKYVAFMNKKHPHSTTCDRVTTAPQRKGGIKLGARSQLQYEDQGVARSRLGARSQLRHDGIEIRQNPVTVSNSDEKYDDFVVHRTEPSYRRQVV